MELNISSIYEDIAAFADAKIIEQTCDTFMFLLKKVFAAVGI